MEIYSFTSYDVALEALASSKIDVLVASDYFDVDTKKLPARCRFAYMVDSPDIDNVREQRAICKFQKADLIYKQILSIYSENAENMSKIKLSDDCSKLITFSSVSAGGAYDKSLTDWKNSANALGNDSMAQNDNSEIAKVKEQFKPEEFQTLINKLTSAKTSLEAEISELEKCKILGTKWKDIGDSNTAEFIINNISDSQKNSISSSDTNGTYDYSSVINEVKATVKKGSPKTSFTSSEENPDLTKPQVRLYTYLYNNYKDNELDYGSGESKAESKKSEKEQELKNQKNTLKSKADEYKNKNTATSIKTSARSVSKFKSSLPSGASSSDEPQGKAETDSDKMKEGSGNNIKEMLEKITGYISSGEIATDFRDNLYITDYVKLVQMMS